MSEVLDLTDKRVINNPNLDRATREKINRIIFAAEVEARSKHKSKQKDQGLFGNPVPLAIGDSSTYYHKKRRPKEEIGMIRNFSTNRGKQTTTGTFGKLISNAIDDDYVDPGKYFLRRGGTI